MSREDLLFSQHELRSVLDGHERKMLTEIDALEGNRLLNTSVDDLCDYFEEEYTVNVPEIQDDKITIDGEEADVDVRRRPNYHVIDRSRPALVRGTSVTFYVPFDGDTQLFTCHPSQFTLAPPHAEFRGSELVIEYRVLEHKPESIRSEFDRTLAEIRKWLGWIASDVKPFNESVRNKARQRIELRREKLLKDSGLVAALGFPLRRREDTPTTYVAPSVRRKVRVKRPTATDAAFVPEPTLDTKEYEHILSVITNMVAVMERSPQSFKGMKEEDLRQHFLVQLNGQYEGQATAETFNFEGKTDILIRDQGKNIFIAECMFWDGPKSLTEKIDQLLGYASWRDTKMAVLVFNRTKNFSDVLAKIPGIVKAHANFKRELVYDLETGSRYVLHNRDDNNRELILTVLAFEVPA